MHSITLDGAKMPDRSAMHDALAEAFSLPAYYGRNLDALWDCLSERCEGAEIIFLSPEKMPEDLFAPLAALLGAANVLLVTFMPRKAPPPRS